MINSSISVIYNNSAMVGTIVCNNRNIVSNNGANDRTNIHTVVSVLDAERSNPTTLIDNPESGTLAAGQPSVQKQIAQRLSGRQS